jgi:hypothetical protein
MMREISGAGKVSARQKRQVSAPAEFARVSRAEPKGSLPLIVIPYLQTNRLLASDMIGKPPLGVWS